jgi:prepilin signal peptidase PulO-like enzyme (type II secretory pathway)
MNAPAAMLTVIVGAMLWLIAARAAVVRGVSLGRVPLGALLATAVLAAARSDAAPAGPIALSAACIAAIADLRTGYIFDRLNVTFGAFGMIAATANHAAGAAILGGLLVGGALYALHLMTLRRGLGLGDVKFGAALGLTLGVSGGALAVAVAFILGGLYGTLLLLTGRATRQTAIRFGPFLASGTYAVVLAPAVLR